MPVAPARAPLPLCLLLLAVVGCGDDPDLAGGPDAAASQDAASPPPDGATPPQDLADSLTDGGMVAGACVARPVPPDDTTTDHFTHPVTYGAMGALTVTKESTLANPEWAGTDHNITLYRPTGDAAYPVLFYSHPFGGTDPSHAEALFQRLASNGYNVVFVPYQLNDRIQQYKQLWVGFRTAVDHYGAKFDMTKVGFVGHSFGGGASPEMARRAFGAPTDNGLAGPWGTAGRMLFIMAPWYSYPGIESPATIADDYHQLPDDVKTVIQLYADDDINDHQIALHDIWDKLPATMTDKGFQLVSSDACGSFALNAGHTTPATYNTGGPGTGNNDHDEWGTARRIHALAAYAFDGSLAGKALAYPKTAEALAMGNWQGMCGDRAVVPLQASTTGLVSSTCGGKAKGDYTFTYSLTGHCQNSATGVGGTPPCR